MLYQVQGALQESFFLGSIEEALFELGTQVRTG